MHKVFVNQRRGFFKNLGMGLAALMLDPKTASAMSPKHPNGLSGPVGGSSDEKYWEMVKRQFLVPEGKIMINSANLCPSPHFVTEQMVQYTQMLVKDVSFQNRAIFDEKRGKALEMLAKYLEVSMEEVGITRNTSESNNIIVNGLDFGPKDEIVVWEQNHPTNLEAWKQRAKRQGFKVIEIQLPEQPTSISELVDHFERAITSKTKLIAFSHISNVSGMALPAKEICAMANGKGILSLVDGAQSFGFMDLDLKKMGCSFYTSSTHKWLMGPMENGILYVRKEQIASLWPNIIGAGWNEDHKTLDEKICVLGQRNTPSTSTVVDILDFHFAIGKAAIEERIRYLNTYLKERIKSELPQARIVTPVSESFSGGVTIVQLPDKDSSEIFELLYSRFGIAAAPTGGLRFSPQINCVVSDIDYLVKVLKELS